MPRGKDDVVPPVVPSNFLGDLARGLGTAIPDLSRIGVGLALRNLAGNQDCIDAIAREMVEDEEENWEKLPGKEKRLWKLRARAALVGLDKHVAAATKKKA